MGAEPFSFWFVLCEQLRGVGDDMDIVDGGGPRETLVGSGGWAAV